jgi:hypothetical protein
MLPVDRRALYCYNHTYRIIYRQRGEAVRRLHPPTLVQWGCVHRWKTTTSRPGNDSVLRVRYLTCRRCGLKVKTEERLAVPWDERDFMVLLAQVFPEDAVVDVGTLRTHGLLGGDLSRLNTQLIPYGWQLEPVRDQGRVVGAVRRRIPPEVSGGTITSRGKEKGGR